LRRANAIKQRAASLLQGGGMRIEDVRDLLAEYDDVREKGTSELPGWYVRDRLVARQLDGDSVLVRADFDARERLLEDHPGTFSLPPSMEAHQKVVVELGRAEATAVRRALAEAVELQRER
jgi:hypothetical protein